MGGAGAQTEAASHQIDSENEEENQVCGGDPPGTPTHRRYTWHGNRAEPDGTAPLRANDVARTTADRRHTQH